MNIQEWLDAVIGDDGIITKEDVINSCLRRMAMMYTPAGFRSHITAEIVRYIQDESKVLHDP
jgi:hypothetical protein